MGELIDALVRVLEFVVQGALAVLLIGFVLAWIHALKQSVYEHAHEMTRYMLGPSFSLLKLHPNAVIAIIVGTLYIAGVVTNSVGYWLLVPAHELVIAAAVPSSDAAQPEPVTALKLVRTVTTRVAFGASLPARREYAEYLGDEVAWRNSNLDAVKHALDPLLKQSRVIRGTAVISLGFMFVAIGKALTFLLCLGLLSLPANLRRPGNWSYKHIVDPYHGETSEGPTKRLKVKRSTTFKYAMTNVAYAVVAFIVLWCALGAYATTEREYHIMAHAGGISAAAAK